MAVNKDKKTGKWYFRVYVDDPISGKRIQKTRKGFELRRDAIDAESIFVAQYQNKDYIIDDILVNNLIDEFLAYQKKRLKITTYTNYNYHIDKHVRPFFDNYKLRDVSKTLLDKWYKYINNKDYTFTYKNKLLIIFKKIFEYSEDQYNFKIRYLSTLVPFQRQPDERDRQIVIYTEQMFNKFISKAENELEKTIFMTFFYSGIRVGELRALKWTDINFDKLTISIERQVTSKVKANRNVILTPKTQSSIRKISIPHKLNNQLIKWKKLRQKTTGFDENWNVFGDYTFITENRLRRMAKSMYTKANLPHIRLHDFRHSYSTLLHNKDIDPKIIQAQAGHSSVQTTLDIYTHITTQQKQQAIINVFDDDVIESE